jgi:hypothetical protein
LHNGKWDVERDVALQHCRQHSEDSTADDLVKIFEGGEEQFFTKNRIRAIHFSLAESGLRALAARRGQRERTGKLDFRRFAHNPTRELRRAEVFLFFFLVTH